MRETFPNGKTMHPVIVPRRPRAILDPGVSFDFAAVCGGVEPVDECVIVHMSETHEAKGEFGE